MLPSKPSISDIGLENHLNDTADQHNGFDYDDFVTMKLKGVDTSNIAKAFGVNRKTIYSWSKIYDQEEGEAIDA